MCNELLIKQEFTPAYSPQYNGVAERRLGLIEEAAMAARIQAKVLFGHVRLPKTDRLWAEAVHWLARHLITQCALLTLTRSRRMRCGMENLVLLDRIRF